MQNYVIHQTVTGGSSNLPIPFNDGSNCFSGGMLWNFVRLLYGQARRIQRPVHNTTTRELTVKTQTNKKVKILIRAEGNFNGHH